MLHTFKCTGNAFYIIVLKYTFVTYVYNRDDNNKYSRFFLASRSIPHTAG